MRRLAITLAGLLGVLSVVSGGCARDAEVTGAQPKPIAAMPTSLPAAEPTTQTASATTRNTTPPVDAQSPSDAHLAPPRRTGP